MINARLWGCKGLHPFRASLGRVAWCALALILVLPGTRAEAAEPVKPASGNVQVMFLPPPLEEAVYSVGIYELGTGRLVRRLHEDAGDAAFTAGLNGFITAWDRQDDAGRTVPAARYAARGWAVAEMKVEGVDIVGNDWVDEHEELRVTGIEGICLVPSDDGLALLVRVTDGGAEVLRVAGKDGQLRWHARIPGADQVAAPFALRVQGERVIATVRGRETAWAVETGRELSPVPSRPEGPDDKEGCFDRSNQSSGRAGTWWVFVRQGLIQLPPGRPTEGELPPSESGVDPDNALFKAAVRYLPIENNDLVFTAVSASKNHDRLYLLEKSDGWQRVRGLEWTATKPDGTGQPISEWKTFFERNIRRPDPALGPDETTPSPVVELPLAKNPLEPGQPQSVKLRAGFDAKGSYLETADGLRLLPISGRANLRAARLSRDPGTPGRLLFRQFDGAAWDVFGVTGAPEALVRFDAGEFELDADGERHPEPPVDEPRDP